jgi:hypothetical protein
VADRAGEPVLRTGKELSYDGLRNVPGQSGVLL